MQSHLPDFITELLDHQKFTPEQRAAQIAAKEQARLELRERARILEEDLAALRARHEQREKILLEDEQRERTGQAISPEGKLAPNEAKPNSVTSGARTPDTCISEGEISALPSDPGKTGSLHYSSIKDIRENIEIDVEKSNEATSFSQKGGFGRGSASIAHEKSNEATRSPSGLENGEPQSPEDAIRRSPTPRPHDFALDDPFAPTAYEYKHDLVDIETKHIGLYHYEGTIKNLTWARFQLFHNENPTGCQSEWQMKIEWSGLPHDQIALHRVPTVFMSFMTPKRFKMPRQLSGKAVQSELGAGYINLKKKILALNKRVRRSGGIEARPGHVELRRRFNHKTKKFTGRYQVPGQYGALMWEPYGDKFLPTFYLWLGGKMKSFTMVEPVTQDRAEEACKFLAYYDCRRK